MKLNPLVIKLGGVILDTPSALDNLFKQIKVFRNQSQHAQQKRDIIIVHGGGCVVDELMARLQLPVKKLNGLRVTPAEQIDFVVGALAGTANKQLLAKAVASNIPAVGLSLADGGLTVVKMMLPELGHVGEVIAGNPNLLTLLCSVHYLPIISSIGVTPEGELMNINADQAAVAIAKAIGADLALLADVSGVLDSNKNVIVNLDRTKADKLIASNVITDGMIVKVNAALDAAKTLGAPVDIASWKDAEKLSDLFAGKVIGTRMIA